MIKEISVNKLKSKLLKKTVILIDVREDFELRIAKIKGSVFIPLNQIPKRICELNKNEKYAIICHTGVRSGYAAQYLINNGYNAYNVKGGIDRWAKDIDKDMMRY